jgi:predicted RNA-binding Zn-ribbon protein involved in translation (DUF1610 family)
MWQSFPPENFVPTRSAIDGIDVFKPAPANPTQQRETVHFACPRCGGSTAYSAADGGLLCTSCDYYEPPQQEAVGKQAEAFEFTVETLQHAAAHGWGQARKELQCQGCGAYTSLPVDSLSHTCPFCGSNNVIQTQSAQDALRPRFLIPFKVEPDRCYAIAREWLGSSWMTPGSLKRLAKVAEFTGIYLPFWTFDANTTASWKAEVGHTTTYRDSKGRSRSRTTWKWESGRAQLNIENLVIPGTSKVSNRLLRQIRNFNFHDLAAYEPTYLAGYQAQAYDITLEQSWETARHDMREQTRQACRNQASTRKIRNFSMELDFSNESWRYVLLPVYLANYHYEQKTFQVMVNGQTGEISGQRPADWAKVLLVVAALLAPGLTLGVIGAITLLFGGIGMVFIIMGFVLLVAGLGWGIRLITQAQRMDDA